MRSAAELHADDSKKFRYIIPKPYLHLEISILIYFLYSIIGSCHVAHSYLWARVLIVSDVYTCMIHDLCAGMLRQKVEGRITRIWSKTLSSGMEDKSIAIDSIFIFLEPVSSNLFALTRNRPALPFREVNQRVDYNRQPHVIQRYHVPSPQNDQYCRHDQAVYSMWMHFVIFCSMELESANSHRHAEAEIAAFAHPRYKYPLESNRSRIPPSSSSKGYQSNSVHTSHQQCFFLDETLAVNPFTNVNRLDVFRNMSCGGERSRQLFSTRESTSCSPSVSSECVSTRKSCPVQVSLDAAAPPERAYASPRNDLQPHFSSQDLHILNPHSGICQPLHFDDSLTLCKVKNLIYSQPQNIDKNNIVFNQSNILLATSHSYFNEKASTVFAKGLDRKATHLNHIVLSGIDHVTSLTSAGAVPNPSLLSHFEQRRTSEKEMGKITSLNAGHRALNTEERGPFDMDEDLKRSLYDLIDIEDTSTSLEISRFSPSDDNIELYSRYLADNYLRFSPVAGQTPEMKSPPNFDMASPTNISNVGSYSPSSVCSILKGSLKNTESLNFNSRYRQGYWKQEQLETQLKQYHMQSERISDQSSIQSQMWQFNKKSDDLGPK